MPLFCGGSSGQRKASSHWTGDNQCTNNGTGPINGGSLVVMKENDKNKLKILMELRPAMEGFAGIPQETRLLFSSFCDIPNIELTGLLNQYSIELLPALKEGKYYKNNKSLNKKIHILSRHVVSHKGVPSRNIVERLFWEFLKRRQRLRLSAKVTIGIPQKLTYFDADDFRDFIWQLLFSKTLPIGDFDKVTGAKFSVLRYILKGGGLGI